MLPRALGSAAAISAGANVRHFSITAFHSPCMARQSRDI
jgi:hypothetical protein